MLGINEALQIRNYVNTYLFEGEEVFSLENAANMYPVPGARSSESYTILAIQVDDLTIMVWIQFTGKGIRVRKAHKQAW